MMSEQPVDKTVDNRGKRGNVPAVGRKIGVFHIVMTCPSTRDNRNIYRTSCGCARPTPRERSRVPADVPALSIVRTLRQIAHHEARQLRTIPVRLWPLVAQETRAARLLAAAHPTRPLRVAAMTLDPRTRLDPT